MIDDNPRSADHKGDSCHENGDPADNTEPLIVTIEPQTKYKYSYDAKQYRLDRARFRLEKKAYCATHWTMIFLIIYTGLTLIVAVASVISAISTTTSANAAEKSMKIAYRARVSINGLGPSVYEQNGKKFFFEDGRVRMNSEVPNVGPFPATNVRYYRYWEIVGDKGNARKLPYQEIFDYPRVIPPKSQGLGTGVAFFTDQLSTEQMRKIVEPMTWTVFSILITYKDDFGDSHSAEYCDLFVLSGPNDVCPWPVDNH